MADTPQRDLPDAISILTEACEVLLLEYQARLETDGDAEDGDLGYLTNLIEQEVLHG